MLWLYMFQFCCMIISSLPWKPIKLWKLKVKVRQVRQFRRDIQRESKKSPPTVF